MSTDLIAFDATKLDLIKRTVAKGATDDELALFLHACKRTGLDPLMKQIHAIKRWSAADQREIMAIQTGIDGYRLIAERTGKYAGSDEPIFEEGQEYPIKASVTVWKLVEGQRMPFTASARWNEYVQKKKDGTVNAFWARMPYGQLGKCAEALALRKAFPAELSGVYTHEEMMQADNPIVNKPLVNIPQVRPRTETVNEILSTDGTQPRQEDGASDVGSSDVHGSLNTKRVENQENSDAPAPLSASERARQLAQEHAGDVPTFTFGKHKGKTVSDPSIPDDYLGWIEGKLQVQVDDPGLARYQAHNQVLLDAVRSEIINRGALPLENV